MIRSLCLGSTSAKTRISSTRRSRASSSRCPISAPETTRLPSSPIAAAMWPRRAGCRRSRVSPRRRAPQLRHRLRAVALGRIVEGQQPEQGHLRLVVDADRRSSSRDRGGRRPARDSRRRSGRERAARSIADDLDPDAARRRDAPPSLQTARTFATAPFAHQDGRPSSATRTETRFRTEVVRDLAEPADG